MSFYSEELEMRRKYGEKALRRMFKLSDTLGFKKDKTLVDLDNDEFNCVLSSVEINQDKLARAKQLMVQKKQQRKARNKAKKQQENR